MDLRVRPIKQQQLPPWVLPGWAPGGKAAAGGGGGAGAEEKEAVVRPSERGAVVVLLLQLFRLMFAA
jgi:hypothetical protein